MIGGLGGLKTEVNIALSIKRSDIQTHRGVKLLRCSTSRLTFSWTNLVQTKKRPLLNNSFQQECSHFANFIEVFERQSASL